MRTLLLLATLALATIAMLAGWRKWFGNPDLPFHFVQLAAWQKLNDHPAHTDDWAIVRVHPLRYLAQPHTGVALAVDGGDADDIHPRNKADVGEQLARWALAKDDGKQVEPSGPLFSELMIEDAKERLSFTHVGQGLMVGRKVGRAPAAEHVAGQLKRLAIAGEDKQGRWAEASIEGHTVVCSSPAVPKPVAVRYAWAINPDGANLYNRDGLPASRFRTDDWRSYLTRRL